MTPIPMNLAFLAVTLASLLLAFAVGMGVHTTQAEVVVEELAPRLGMDKYYLWDHVSDALRRDSGRRAIDYCLPFAILALLQTIGLIISFKMIAIAEPWPSFAAIAMSIVLLLATLTMIRLAFDFGRIEHRSQAPRTAANLAPLIGVDEAVLRVHLMSILRGKSVYRASSYCAPFFLLSVMQTVGLAMNIKWWWRPRP